MQNRLHSWARGVMGGIVRSLSSVAASVPLSASTQLHSASSVKCPWLIVGLGNPLKLFDGTRHNVGFEMIDALSDAEGIRIGTTQHKALIGKGQIESFPVLLVKPRTFMNLSGESVGALATFYRIPPQKILLVYDDMDLEFARLRILPNGGHGGHNGMKSVIEHLKGCQDFPRLRIGIGRPHNKMLAPVFVLKKFSKDERKEMDMLFARGIDVIRQVIIKGVDKACSTCNEPRNQLKAMQSAAD
ncbi:hypothetical protein KP509_38G033300 [Ceratopteris richardii]|uniref:peptidyl-tRNA hydrolase n=1 Tax=Ceratopteris richardii TaxID=49495 RepID=A0A8T2Q3R7_CERRI|nr:hypothetical protein KP509_38G033300 [Ceratopteris richardii]